MYKHSTNAVPSSSVGRTWRSHSTFGGRLLCLSNETSQRDLRVESRKNFPCLVLASGPVLHLTSIPNCQALLCFVTPLELFIILQECNVAFNKSRSLYVYMIMDWLFFSDFAFSPAARLPWNRRSCAPQSIPMHTSSRQEHDLCRRHQWGGHTHTAPPKKQTLHIITMPYVYDLQVLFE